MTSSSRDLVQGNLMQCFHATVNRVKTLFPEETVVMNRETVSRVVFIQLQDLLRGKCWEISS